MFTICEETMSITMTDTDDVIARYRDFLSYGILENWELLFLKNMKFSEFSESFSLENKLGDECRNKLQQFG